MASGNVLTVGPGQQYSTIAAAAAAAQSGDTIDVQAGTYTNDFVGVYSNVTLQAVGGVVTMVANTSPSNGKAIIDEGGPGVSVTINGFDISGAAVPYDDNGAAIRYEGGNLTLNNDYFHNNQDGLLAASDTAGSITINNSEFAFNGTGDGYTHNLYVNDLANLTITNSYFHDANEGHEIKSRAENTTITGSRIFDNNSTASYSIDLPNGGNATIQNDVIQQGPNSDNPAIIAYGEEGSLHTGTSVTIANNTIVNDKTSAIGVWNQTAYAVTLQNTSVYGLTSANLTSGPANVSGTTYLASRPTLDTSSHWMPTSTLTPNDLAVATPASETVTAGGTVPVGGVSISDPWAATASGTMTLNVSDTGGGTIALAGHTATSSGRISVTGTLAQLNADLAGLSYTAGAGQGVDTITVDVLNQASVEVTKTIGVTVNAVSSPPPVTTGTGSDTLVLSMSEDAYNGDAQFTVAVDGTQLGGTFTTTALHATGAGQNFTFDGDWAPGAHTVTVTFLNDAYGGTSATDRNLYVNAVSYDGTATGQSAALYSSGGHNFGVTDTTAIPGTPPPATTTVTTGTGTGTGSDTIVLSMSEDAYSGDAQFTVAVDGTQLGGTFTTTALHAAGASQNFTFNGDWAPGAHTVTVTFLNDAYGGTSATDRNLYVNAVSYDGTATGQSAALYSNGGHNFSVTDTTAIPGTPPPAMTSVTTGTGSDSLVLSMSEDAYNGDAQFTVAVDGMQLGGTFTTTALHAAGASQDFSFNGDWAAGAHTVTVTFLNDAYGGTAATDRNLYVNAISYDGTATGQSAALYNDGGQNFSVTDTTAIPGTTTATASSSTIQAATTAAALTTGSQMAFLQPSTTSSPTASASPNTIVAGAGNDVLTGGTGDDIFKFLAGFGQATITDFAPGPAGSQDLIDLSALGITAATFAGSVGIAGSGDNTTITIGANSIKLLDVAPSSIDITDFKLA